MQSPSSQSVHNRRQEKQLHRNHPLLRALLEVAGVMVLILGVIATSPASGVQEREANHDFEVDLVDFQPHDSTDQLDSTDQEEMIEESEDQNGASVEPPMQETETETDPFFYENCDAARAAGAAPVHEGEHGFGPHLDADNDGIGCELGR